MEMLCIGLQTRRIREADKPLSVIMYGLDGFVHNIQAYLWCCNSWQCVYRLSNQSVRFVWVVKVDVMPGVGYHMDRHIGVARLREHLLTSLATFDVHP